MNGENLRKYYSSQNFTIIEKKEDDKNWLTRMKCNICNNEILYRTNDLSKGQFPICRSCRQILYDNLIGSRFDRLTVLNYFKNEKSLIVCRCKCDCGEILDVYLHNLIIGHTKSCGCLKNKRFGDDDLKKLLNHRYRVMVNNCRYKKKEGVIIADVWLGDKGFENYYKWCITNGFSLEENTCVYRKDNKKPYSPKNCYIKYVKKRSDELCLK